MRISITEATDILTRVMRKLGHAEEDLHPIVDHLIVPPVPNQHAEWLAHIHQGTQPRLSNIWTARHVSEVLLAAQESNQVDAPIPVASAPSLRDG